MSSSINIYYYLIVFFVIGPLFGWWAGAVGKGNGRSFGPCFLIGYFLGLIGVLIVYVIGRSPQRRQVQQPQPWETPYSAGNPPPPPEGSVRPIKACSLCGNLIDGDATYCQYCGAEASAAKPWT